MNITNWRGFAVIGGLDVPPGGAVQVEYRGDGKDWLPASVLPNLTEEEIQSPASGDWNCATQFQGLVHGYMIRDNQVYWNYFVNFDGVPERRDWQLRVRQCGDGGRVLREDVAPFTIDPGDTVILSNWFEWQGVRPEVQTVGDWRSSDPADVEPGWYVIRDAFGAPRLSGFGSVDIGAIEYHPHLAGHYDCFVGFREGFLECILDLPGRPVPTTLYLHPRNMPSRLTKEIFVGNCEFRPDDPVRIRRRPNAPTNKLRRFGDMLYLKFVPAAPRPVKAPAFVPPGKETVFYAEPYSMCYSHYCQNEAEADLIAQTYQLLGVDKVVAQTGRVGCAMMHYSKLAGFLQSAVSGDDRQSSNGGMEAMKHMEVMKVLGEACRRRGMKFLADIGVNSPYVNSPLESPWMRKHMDCLYEPCKFFLDYAREEVMEFAAGLYAELALEYDFDGISVNYTRNFMGNLTQERILELHRRIVAKIGAKRRAEQEIHVSILACTPDLYHALEKLLEENLVDSVTVGRQSSLYPFTDLTPYRRMLDRFPGRKLYGKIDGWTVNHTGLNQGKLPRPAECAELAESYFKAGADGIYFYQSEGILIDPFLRRFVRSLKGERA